MNNLVRTILVDDEIRAMLNLEGLLSAHPEILILEKITDSSKAVSVISERQPDLVFLDIQMPGKSGFEVVSELCQHGCRPAIIFVTGFDHFAIEAIRHAALDYLVKPVNPEELNHALDRYASRSLNNNQEEKIKILIEKTFTRPKLKLNTLGGFTMIRPEEVIYVKADWNYCELFFGDGKTETVASNIGTLSKMLPREDFFRLSRSILINVNFLSKVNRKSRVAILANQNEEICLKIPLLNIRKLEHFLK